MGNLLSRSKPQALPTVPTDTIIPMHHMDDSAINRSMIVIFMMRFDDVLDPEKMKGSLEKLLSRDDWRKLGSRMRLNENGNLDYHMPEKFDEKRPAFGYSHVKYDVEIGKHPLASRLPKASSKPAVVGNPDDFRTLMRRDDGPSCFDDYIYRDEPQLSMHIVSFEDATLVSLSWAHTFLDAMGRRELLQAWIATLEGRDADVKPLHGVHEDPLADFGAVGSEHPPYALAHTAVAGLNKLLFVARFVFELVWHPKEENRIVCLPAAHVRRLRAEATADLEAEHSGSEKDGGGATPFLSEGDVVTGYITRLVVEQLEPPESTRTVSIMNAFGLRAMLADDLLPSSSAYVANAVSGVFALVSARDILTKPLSVVASAIRRSIAEQGERGQVEARRAIDRASLAKTGQPALFGDSGMMMVIFSNWTKGRFFETDFSAAVVAGAGTSTSTSSPERAAPHHHRKVGRPSYIQTVGYSDGTLPLRNAFPVIGKDGAGNYWFSGSLRKGVWDRIEEKLSRSE